MARSYRHIEIVGYIIMYNIKLFFFTYERDVASLELEREIVLLLVLGEVIMVGESLRGGGEIDNPSKIRGKG